jgi:hypothetical protein
MENLTDILKESKVKDAEEVKKEIKAKEYLDLLKEVA